MDWQPIETAPKDGTRILLYFPVFGNSPHQEFGRWEEQAFNNKPNPYWSGDGEAVYGVQWYRRYPPSHWMHILKPPVLGNAVCPPVVHPSPVQHEPVALVKWQVGGKVVHLIGDVPAGAELYASAQPNHAEALELEIEKAQYILELHGDRFGKRIAEDLQAALAAYRSSPSLKGRT